MNTKDNTHLFSILHSRHCAHKHIIEQTSAFPNSELSESSDNWIFFFFHSAGEIKTNREAFINIQIHMRTHIF